MARTRVKSQTLELKLTCQMPQGTNQQDFLNHIRLVLFDENVKLDDQKPKVTVISSKTVYLDL